MKRINGTISLGGLLLVTLMLLSSTARAQSSTRTVGVSGVSNVKIETITGTDLVDVRGWDKAQVKVECRGGKLMVATKAGTILIQNDLESGCETIKVNMPKSLKLKIQAVSGDVSVSGLGNRVDITSVSGDVRVTNVSGATDIEIVSGDLDVRSVRGDFSCKAVSGQVEIADLTAQRLDVKNVSGDIEIENIKADDIRLVTHSGEIEYKGLSTPKKELKVKSFSGDLKILLPSSGGFDVTAKTQSGSVKIEHKIKASERSENEVSGIYLKGGPDVSLTTYSGDIELLAPPAPPAPPSPPSAPAPPAPPKSK